MFMEYTWVWSETSHKSACFSTLGTSEAHSLALTENLFLGLTRQNDIPRKENSHLSRRNPGENMKLAFHRNLASMIFPEQKGKLLF